MTEYIKITPSPQMRSAVLAAAGLADLLAEEDMTAEAGLNTEPATYATMPAGLVAGSREHRAFSAHTQAGVEAIAEASK